jgi:hypothetical protein
MKKPLGLAALLSADERRLVFAGNVWRIYRLP